MKYKYDFSTGGEEIEVSKKWDRILRELDHEETYSDIKQTKPCVHYDAFEDPGYLANSLDKGITSLFDGSPAFDYAVAHLLPKYYDLLKRRVLSGEMFTEIAKDYGVGPSNIRKEFQLAVTRFTKLYNEGLFLCSSENLGKPESERIRCIPYGLTPEDVIAIRAYRREHKSIREIMALVGATRHAVTRCLHENPVLDAPCPYCGKPVPQDPYGNMRTFCSDTCYERFFRENSLGGRSGFKTFKGKKYLTREQKLAIDYYRQLHLGHRQIRKIMGLSEQVVSAHCYEHELPWTPCLHCGKKIPGTKGGKLIKYCSPECRNKYWGHEHKMRSHQIGRPPEMTLPMPEQLYYAVELYDHGILQETVIALTGLSEERLEALFRFDDSHIRECPVCHARFQPSNESHRYCSSKCREKAKQKRRRARKKAERKACQKSDDGEQV